MGVYPEACTVSRKAAAIPVRTDLSKPYCLLSGDEKSSQL